MSFDRDDLASNLSDEVTDKAKTQVMKQGSKIGNKVVRQGSKLLRQGVKHLAKAAVSFIKAIIAFLQVAWPVVLAIVLILGLFALIWTWSNEERGTTGSYSQDPSNSNVTVTDKKGVEKVVALTENNAYINAYYQFMSCSSYVKNVGSETNYTFRENTADFAGLQDYYNKENYFYLSSNFIMMADEMLHRKGFYYPEQVIKPVYYEKNDAGAVKMKKLLKEDGSLEVTSKEWNQELTAQTEQKVPGVWDYGFGSVLKYKPGQKQQFITCEYKIFNADIDVYVSDGNGFGHWEHSQVIEVPIPDGITPQSAYDLVVSTKNAYTSDTSRCTTISPETLSNLVKEQSHIDMKLSGTDIPIGKRVFESPELQEYSNQKDFYPIKVPLIDSAATFSGNIEYSYADVEQPSIDIGDGVSAYTYDPVNQIQVGSTSCDVDLLVTREGKQRTILPTQVSEKDEPVSFEYIGAYCDHYKTYIPSGVQGDLNFAKRISADSKVKALLDELGLMKKYTSMVASEGSNYNVFTPSKMTEEQFNSLLDGTDFSGLGNVFVECENTYGVNGLYAIAVAQLETGISKGASKIAKNANNYYNVTGDYNGQTWRSPSGRKWSKYPSATESIQDFFDLMCTTTYKDKTIEEINAIFCPEGDPGNGADYYKWAIGVKDIMKAKYTTAVSNGASADILKVGMASSVKSDEALPSEACDAAISAVGTSRGTLYSNVQLDVLASTNMLQNLRDPNSSIFKKLEIAVSDLGTQIKGFFTEMNGVFKDNSILTGKRIEYGTRIVKRDVEDIVFQAMTFTLGELYSTVENAAATQTDLMFLFVGKESALGLGTGSSGWKLIPGVGTTIEGFISPTTMHCQTLTPWSADTGGVVLSVPKGTVIQSVADNGVVTDVVKNSEGYSVTIKYSVDGKDYQVIYKYLESVNVSVNTNLKSGDQVGKSGVNSQGAPSLFFGFVNADGANVDPLGYFYQPSGGNSNIVNVALSQVGNRGGQPYWSWAGSEVRIEWCACFVSWCADQCGFIERNIIPKFTSCTAGANWFKKQGQWQNAGKSYSPKPGDIIFFDWDNDGGINHVGIVKSCENGMVYTVEGNTGGYPGVCKEGEGRSVSDPQIEGYGLPAY